MSQQNQQLPMTNVHPQFNRDAAQFVPQGHVSSSYGQAGVVPHMPNQVYGHPHMHPQQFMPNMPGNYMHPGQFYQQPPFAYPMPFYPPPMMQAANYPQFSGYMVPGQGLPQGVLPQQVLSHQVLPHQDLPQDVLPQDVLPHQAQQVSYHEKQRTLYPHGYQNPPIFRPHHNLDPSNQFASLPMAEPNYHGMIPNVYANNNDPSFVKQRAGSVSSVGNVKGYDGAYKPQSLVSTPQVQHKNDDGSKQSNVDGKKNEHQVVDLAPPKVDAKSDKRQEVATGVDQVQKGQSNDEGFKRSQDNRGSQNVQGGQIGNKKWKDRPRNSFDNKGPRSNDGASNPGSTKNDKSKRSSDKFQPDDIDIREDSKKGVSPKDVSSKEKAPVQ